jgi:hypothetical protein
MKFELMKMNSLTPYQEDIKEMKGCRHTEKEMSK